MNVRIACYGDLAECRQAVASVTDTLPDATIHVCDGRYATFDGDTDLTPGLRDFATAHPSVRYHSPPDEYLPFGWELLKDGTPPKWRPGVHAKARWIDSVLPQETWTLKLDTDERLRSFDVDLGALDRTTRYAPEINLHGDDKPMAHVARLWVPTHWTRWIDDCLLPRAIFPRDTPLEILQRVWRTEDFRMIRFVRLLQTHDITIDNYGADRPADYQRRRVEHLERIGRDDRWAELAGRMEDYGSD